jgi:hypothetical protein
VQKNSLSHRKQTDTAFGIGTELALHDQIDGLLLALKTGWHKIA